MTRNRSDATRVPSNPYQSEIDGIPENDENAMDEASYENSGTAPRNDQLDLDMSYNNTQASIGYTNEDEAIEKPRNNIYLVPSS